MILLIDNYDSFVYNLARYLREMGCNTRVVRNDALSLDDVCEMAPHAIVISPGPCTPSLAGISVDVVRTLSQRIPILGVCLGHQAIGEALGGAIVRSPAPVHGMCCRVHHDRIGLFAGLPAPLWAGRYHSLCIDEQSLPHSLRVTARSDDGVIMAVAHATRPLFGVQFHPESVLTESGHRLLSNFLTLAGVAHTIPAVGDYDKPTEPDGYPLTADVGTPITW
ncbi:MAG TPA: aminodeoxychorismate/anthranilate synthase component II [Planctomycetaceae bacterium]|jgi:anthranilate synthase/aminodeoxychorismate synthase-like glutamine amidotransferase|nr:aminodeoxychorismate/anthranilate synthase component II [Planctomycetaceae bacterium]